MRKQPDSTLVCGCVSSSSAVTDSEKFHIPAVFGTTSVRSCKTNRKKFLKPKNKKWWWSKCDVCSHLHHDPALWTSIDGDVKENSGLCHVCPRDPPSPAARHTHGPALDLYHCRHGGDVKEARSQSQAGFLWQAQERTNRSRGWAGLRLRQTGRLVSCVNVSETRSFSTKLNFF